MSTCRNHMFFDPTCIYCNSRASREANEEAEWAAHKTMRATQEMQAAQGREFRARSKARDAAKAESRRQQNIEWSQQQRQRRRVKATKRSAARKAQGGGLLPREKLWIYGGLLLCWGISIVTSYQEGRWISFVFFLAVGGGVGYVVYKRATKGKGTPAPPPEK